MRRPTQLLALFLGVPAILAAQTPTSRDMTRHVKSGRWTVDGVYSRMWVPRPFPENWTMTNAVGARALWHSGRRAGDGTLERAPLFSVGAQFNVTPTQTLDFGRYRVATYGGLIEYLPLGSAYRLDPVLSLWSGVVRSTVEAQRLPSTIMKLPEGTTTQLAAAPALGLRVWLGERLGVRADYRHTIVRHDRWYGVPEIANGLTFRF